MRVFLIDLVWRLLYVYALVLCLFLFGEKSSQILRKNVRVSIKSNEKLYSKRWYTKLKTRQEAQNITTIEPMRANNNQNCLFLNPVQPYKPCIEAFSDATNPESPKPLTQPPYHVLSSRSMPTRQYRPTRSMCFGSLGQQEKPKP